MEKFTCPSRIIKSIAVDIRSFVLTTFSALSKSPQSLIIHAVAFTTKACQFRDLLSALFTQTGILLLQKISFLNLGVRYFSTILESVISNQ